VHHFSGLWYSQPKFKEKSQNNVENAKCKLLPVIALLAMNRTIEFSCIIWRSHTKVASDTSETSFVIQSKRCGQFFSFRFKNLSLTSHTFSGFINWFDNFVICRSKRSGSGSDTMFDRVASSTINESNDGKKNKRIKIDFRNKS
jgi:hypothetical protein